MKKATRLRICAWSLAVLTAAILASSIQLEATHSQGTTSVWIHIALGSAFLAAVIWHLYLHFKWKQWARRLRAGKSQLTSWLAALGALTFITAAATLIHWTATDTHSAIGGIHGKLGFIFAALAIAHTARRIKFFRK